MEAKRLSVSLVAHGNKCEIAYNMLAECLECKHIQLFLGGNDLRDINKQLGHNESASDYQTSIFELLSKVIGKAVHITPFFII